VIIENMLGNVVYSKNGRDKGRMFVVIKIVNDRFVLLADGDLRKVEKPNLKNIKHLQFTKMKASDVLDYLKNEKIPGNHVIRNNLKRLQECLEINGKEVW
jgi:ribosomal protein L14E/L6E/L27E